MDEKGHRVWLKKGPYGLYLEREAEPFCESEEIASPTETPDNGTSKASKVKTQKVAVPATTNAQDMSLEYALDLLSFPRSLGTDPESEEEVTLNLGPYGFYIKSADVSATIPKKVSLCIVWARTKCM